MPSLPLPRSVSAAPAFKLLLLLYVLSLFNRASFDAPHNVDLSICDDACPLTLDIQVQSHPYPYPQFPSQDSGLFGPNPWKILAPPSKYLSTKGFWATQPLDKSLVRENIAMGTGCTPIRISRTCVSGSTSRSSGIRR